jgi:uncharacterized membrane-anchored protein
VPPATVKSPKLPNLNFEPPPAAFISLNRRSHGAHLGIELHVAKSQSSIHRGATCNNPNMERVNRHLRRLAKLERGKDLAEAPNRYLAAMLNKVPEVTLAFWIIKIMSTTVGETGADYLAVHVGLGKGVTNGVVAATLIVALLLQLSVWRYVPWRYWLTVVLVSVVGTQLTDALTDSFGVSLYLSTSVFAVLLAGTFAIWYAIERTLSIHTIVTQRRELFYWAAILFTFALGTAAGDLATESLQLGFKLGVLVFGAFIGLTALAYYRGANPILTFWIAYVLTRPLGASLGDLLSQAQTYGGLGLGTVATSLVFLIVIVTLVTFLSLQSNGTKSTAKPAEIT